MDGTTCNKSVTLVHHTRGTDSDTYTCYPIEGVSWYEKVQVTISSDGSRPKNTIISRIPAANMPECMPEISDFIVYGTVSDIARPADLKGQKYFQIKSVSDNRQNCLLPHVRVSGS